MAGESAQMRAIRKHLSRELRWPLHGVRRHGLLAGGRAPAAASGGPGTDLARGQGGRQVSDAEIWAAYDAAQEAQEAEDAQDGPA